MLPSKLHSIIIGALCLVILFLVYQGCEQRKEKENLLNQVSQYQLGEKAFKEKILKDSSKIVQQVQTILSQDEAIKLHLLEGGGDISKVESQVKEKQVIKYKDVKIPYVPDNYADTSGWAIRLRAGDTSKAILDSLIANSIIIPKSFSFKSEWMNIDGKIQKESLVLDSMKIKNESTITVGWKKGGFLNLSRIPIVEIKNTNPYLSVTQMSNVVIQKKKGLFQKPLVWAVAGLIGGLLIK